LHVIARIDDPFGPANVGKNPLKIGQYVTAEIGGNRLEDVLVIPNNSIYQGSYVYVVENEVLRRRDIVIAWQNDDDAVIERGLQHEDQLVITPLGQVTSGIKVSIIGEGRSAPGGPGTGRPAADGERQRGTGQTGAGQ
jgi:hypothetical protein